MPRASKVSKQPEAVSPSRPQRYGSKQLAENLSKDELLKRLKKIAKELSEADQDKKLEEYAETAASLAKPFILKHPDKDVRLYAAFCLVNLLRIFVPNHPYDRNQLWSIFNLTIGMLEGLRNPKGSSFEKLFSILECLAFTKTVNICLQMDFSDLILKLFKTLFNSIRPEHSKKVVEYMLDMMSTILNEAESVSQQLLDTILENIINPKKTSHQCCCNLATLLLKRTAPAIEPYVQLFFHNALFFDKASDSQLLDYLYDVVYELFKICPSVLLSVLPQLEFKLKSNVESERLEVTKMLGNMFADENSDLAQSHKPLWQCYLGRFVDINPNVRVECTKHAKYFFVNHPELVDDISEKLHGRQRDPDEKVRMEVVTTICEAASENVTSVSEKLFEVVTERLRDRKLHIRKDTMMSLGRLYKKILGSDVNNNDMKKISWIPTKILHCYYQNSPEDRLCVERVFLGCLVPVTLGSKERVRRMLTLYQKLDAPATKAFNHMLKSQASLRSDLSEILRYWQEHQKRNSEESKKRLTVKISMIAKVLPDPAKTQEHLKKLVQMLSDKKLFELMKICVGSGQECSKVSKAVSEVAIKFGAKNPLFETVKALLDRGAPLLFDSSAGKQLVTLVSQCVDDENIDGEDDTEDDDRDEDEISVNGRKALDLLLTCATAFPSDFKFSLIFEKILVYLKRNDFVADVALQILTHIGQNLEEVDSRLMSYYQQALTKLFTTGTPSQVKLAGCAINKIFSNPLTIFERILENQLDCLDSESLTLISTLSCLGQIALLAPKVFEKHNTTVIRDFVVKDLLMKDKGKGDKGSALWCEESELSKEIKAKIQGVKLLVNWLRGLQTKDKAKVQPVLRILDNVLKKDGDMTGRSRVRPCEMSYMRLTAACGLLKLCQESAYHEFIDIEYFMNLSSIMQDPCTHVRAPFTKKLCKGLESMKLPLEYLTLFALSAKESSKDRRQQVKQMICRCINVRNEYLKQHSSAAVHSASVLPEYALPYLIYLLSHRANVDYSEVESLKDIKTYLWFFMEPILARGDNYNFMKKLAENVKQTKDARAPNDVDANNAIYTVCDIAIGIILNLSKTQTFLLKDFPGNLVLPKKLFVPLGKGEGNSKSYLPKDFLISPVKKTSNNVSKITPSKSVHSSSFANKKKPQTTKRVSETRKTKKTQRALMDILGKETTESSEELSEEEEEIPRKKSGPTRKEATKKTSPQKSLTSARKRSSETANHQGEKRSRKVSATPMKEETPTRSSPRKNVKSSTSVENIVKNTRVSETEGALMDILGKETTKSSEELSEDEEEIPRKKTAPTRKKTRQNPSPQETLTSPAKTRSSETVNHQDEGQSKNVSKSPMKEENPTRSSPRKNVKSSTSVENIVRSTRTNDLSDEATESSEQSELVSPEPQSPVEKRKTVEEVNPKEPLEQSSLNIKRKRKRR